MPTAVTVAVAVTAAAAEVQVDAGTIAVVAVIAIVACNRAAAVTAPVLVPAAAVRHRFSG